MIPMRTLLAALALALLLAAPADARRLKPAGKLRATAVPGAVKLTWKDRARGETRWVVARTGRKARLKRNRRAWTDRRISPGVTYRYTVRPCRRARCAKRRSVTVTALGGTPGAPGRNDPPSPDPYAGSPTIGGCAVFPRDNPWNADVSQAPVLHDYIDTFPATMPLWPDFGGAGAYGIPYVTVPAGQPLVPVSFDVADESDPGPYPIPLDAPVEGGGDRHVLAVRQGDCKLFELYAAERAGAGWSAYSGARVRPALERAATRRLDVGRRRRTADPAGPGAPRRGRRRRHPARAADHGPAHVGRVHPSRRRTPRPAATAADPPMGLRLRLRADYDISFLQGQARAVAQALKTYGALVADNAGGNPDRIYVSGATDLGWNDDVLGALKQIPASALEAAQTGPVIPAH